MGHAIKYTESTLMFLSRKLVFKWQFYNQRIELNNIQHPEL